MLASVQHLQTSKIVSVEKARPVFTMLSSRGTRWPRNHPLVSSISRAWHRFSRSNRINTDKPGDSCHGSRRFWSTFNGQLRKIQTAGRLRDAIPFVRGWIQRGLGQDLMDLSLEVFSRGVFSGNPVSSGLHRLSWSMFALEYLLVRLLWRGAL